jgi:hypothetical protein
MATVEEIKQEIVDYLNEAHKDDRYRETYTLDNFTGAFWQWVEDLTWRNTEIELKSGTAKTVKFIDAGEGDYSAAILLVFDVNGQLFRVDGQYESWAGAEWEANDMYEVVPTPVQVIEYLRKDSNGI